MTYSEWVSYGIEKGYMSDVFCWTHDSPPMTDEESAEFDEGNDPCIFLSRFYEPETNEHA